MLFVKTHELSAKDVPLSEAVLPEARAIEFVHGSGNEGVAPVGPVAPCGPVGPGTVDAAPVGPVGPGTVDAGPVAPCGPVGPGFPCIP